jgi:2-polyprenyl-3-methyl-5-hydroxy-6-metoxy-1,4-benzoquinol methylase
MKKILSKKLNKFTIDNGTEVKNTMKNSPQLTSYYKIRDKRENFNKLYKSEKIIFKKFLKKGSSVLDVGCLFGSLKKALKDFNINYKGIDTDLKAINFGKKYQKGISIYHKNFMKPTKQNHKYDFVFALNVFDHFIKWKEVIKNLKKYSKKYVFFTTHLKTTGSTIIDKDISYMPYEGGGAKILPWSVFNIFEIIAYASSYEINAKNIYIYAYNKYHKKNIFGPNNLKTASLATFPIDPREILVGSVVIELNNKLDKKNLFIKPTYQIYINNSLYLKSWK